MTNHLPNHIRMIHAIKEESKIDYISPYFYFHAHPSMKLPRAGEKVSNSNLRLKLEVYLVKQKRELPPLSLRCLRGSVTKAEQEKLARMKNARSTASSRPEQKDDTDLLLNMISAIKALSHNKL